MAAYHAIGKITMSLLHGAALAGWSGAGCQLLRKVVGYALLAVMLVGFLFLAACGGGDDSPGTVHGKLTDVQTRSFTEIESFSLLDEGGETWLFDTEGPLELTPSHLREHMLVGEEVSVEYERRDGGLVAVSISDYP
jgi:hypothetical protein